MKNYLKITLSVVLIILMVAVYRTYALFDNVNIRYQESAFLNFKILFHTTEYHLSNYDKISKSIYSKNDFKSKNFIHTYNNKDTSYKSDVVVVSEKCKNKDIQEAIAYLKENNSTYFYKKHEDGHYTYIKKFDKLSNDKKQTYFSLTIDNSKEAKQEKRHLFILCLVIIGLIFAVCLITYKFFKKVNLREKEFLEKLKNEIKAKTDDLNQKNKELIYKFYHDTLTKLPNRRHLLDDIEKYENVDKALILVNLDNFKELNDFYGYQIGDEVLVSFGNFLSSCAQQYNSKAYRLHADEYAIFIFEVTKDDLKSFIARFLYQMKNLSIMTEDDYTIEIQGTLGISYNNQNPLSSANMALKRAKKENLPYLFYEKSLRIESQYEYNLNWTKKIKLAIRNKKILAYCQPIMNSVTKKVNKFEVLVRLQDEKGNIITPYKFLDVAKKNKFYSNITTSIINQAFDAFKDTDYSFSINISILDILNPEIMKFIFEKIKKYPKPEKILFEILESEGVKNFEEISRFIEGLKENGCKIALDDFGSGYSNFVNILSLQVDLLKIDGSLIKNIDTNQNAYDIVSTIISFANKLNIETCAEFVHSKEIFHELIAMNTTYLQGYYIGEPFSIKELKNYKTNLSISDEKLL